MAFERRSVLLFLERRRALLYLLAKPGNGFLQLANERHRADAVVRAARPHRL